MRRVIRIISAVLATVFAASALSGCGGGGKENKVKSDNTAAMGRYKETEIALPEDVKDNMLYSFMRGTDGNMELYSGVLSEEGIISEVCRHIYKEGMWTKDESWWGNALLDDNDLNLHSIAYGLDGNYYMGGTDPDYKFHLLQVTEDGSSKEVLSEVFIPAEGSKYGLIPTRYTATSEGNILLCGYRETYLYKSDGTKLYTMPHDFSGNTNDVTMFAADDEFVTFLNGDVVCYSLDDGQVKETITHDGIESEGDEAGTILFNSRNNGIYAANEAGLFHINRGGTVWENLIDGSLNSMGMRSIYMASFMEGDNKDYYGLYSDDLKTGMQLFHYTYDPNMMSVPPVTLNIYALKDSSTVRQAASLLQKDNPDIRVEFRVALQEDQDSMKNDVIRSLNTELLSGKGADVLILDGLPLESYIDKGILMDMKDVFVQIQKENPIFPNIMEGFVRDDGSVYGMPARISFPVVIGESRAVQAYSSLESMKSYQGELPLVSADIYENLLRLVAHIQYKEMFADGLEGLNEEMLATYLETVKTLGEMSGSKVVFTDAESEVAHVNNNVMPKGIRGSGTIYDREMSSSGLELFDSVFSTALPWAVMEKRPEASMQTVNDIYFPLTLVGINQATGQKEAAEQFVKYLFSTAVQGLDLNDGFSVMEEGLQEWNLIEKGNYMIGTGDGTYELSADWPSKEKRTKVFDMIPLLKVPANIDETVMGMIVNESKEYFEGKANLSQTASAVSQKIKLYLAE